MIQVLLVDEQRLFSEAIQSLISDEADIHVTGMAKTGNEAIKKAMATQPDIILMDIDLPIATSINTAIHLKKHFPDIKIIFLTAKMREELIVAAIATGADGFLYKDLDASNLIQAIRDAHNNQTVISGEVAKVLAKKITEIEYSKHQIIKKQLRNYDIKLTERELDIAIMVLDGMRNKEIAEELELGQGTIKNYISELYDKLGLRNRQYVTAFLRGLISRYYQ